MSNPLRLISPIMTVLLGFAAIAAGQSIRRFELGPVLRVDTVHVEEESDPTAIAGVAGTFRISNTYGIEGELTEAARRFERSWEGESRTYADADEITPQEWSRMAPLVRESVRYLPRIGWSMAFVAQSELSPRVSIMTRLGYAARNYLETSTFTILRFPDGVDPDRVVRDFQRSSNQHWRRGFLGGMGVSLAVTEHLTVAPEIRLVYSGRGFSNKHREVGLGARAGWRF